MDTEKTLDFPKEIFQNNFGIGVDHGDATIKAVYTSEVEDRIRVHFNKCPSHCHEEIYKLLCEKCADSLPRDREYHTNVCGLRTKQHVAQDGATNKLRLRPKSDLACLVAGFRLLAETRAWNDWFEPPDPRHITDAANMINTWREFVELMCKTGSLLPITYTEMDSFLETKQLATDCGKLEYPLIICDIGSGYRAIKVEADGTYCVVDEMAAGGKTVNGLASILLGTKSWKEILDLAEKGNPSNIDTYTTELNMNPEDELYSALETSQDDAQKVFPFGKVVGKTIADVEKADLAISLLDLMPDIIMTSLYSQAILHEVKQIFIVGGFLDTSRTTYVRKLATIAAYVLRFWTSQEHGCDLYFMKNAEFVSALGSLVMNMGYKGKQSEPE